MPSSENDTSNTGRLSYQRCLIPDIRGDLQLTIYDVTNFILMPLGILLAFLSVISNFLVLMAVLRVKSLQHPSQLLLSSLSTTDLLFAVCFIVESLERYTHDDFCPKETSHLSAAVHLLCYSSTMGSMVIISKDRHLAVSKPWWYRNHVTRSRVIKQATVIWLYSIFILGIKIASSHFTVLRIPLIAVSVLFHTISIVVMVACYIGIFLANLHHRRTIQPHGDQLLAREKKLANTVGLIVIVLFFTFLPGIIFALVLKIMGFSPTQALPFRPLYHFLITLNGLLNPLLNYGRNKGVRRAVRGLLVCPRCIISTRRVVPTREEGNSEEKQNCPYSIEENGTLEIPLGQRENQTQVKELNASGTQT